MRMLPLPMLLLLSACTGGVAEPEIAIDGVQWRLVAFRAADGQAPEAPEAEATVTFDGENSRIAGLAACNRYQAAFERSGESLTVGPIAASKKLCPEPKMRQENRFIAWLGDATTLRVVAGQLVIATSRGDELRFEAAD